VKNKNSLYQKTVFFAVAAIATTGGLATPVSANPTALSSSGPATSTQTTPAASKDDAFLMAAITGQCRQTNRLTGIFSGPADTTGTRVGVVNQGDVVRLADEGNAGWIKVNYPKDGYVQAANLVFLSACPPYVGGGSGDQSLCRLVNSPPEGLIIRKAPNPTSADVGGVAQGSRVTLTTNPATTSKEANGRTWVQIATPAAGWVSNGFPGTSNLVYCSPPTPPPPGNRCRRVIRPDIGLLIQKDPSTTAATVGGLALYQKFRLTTDPATTSKDSAGRTWVQIDQPVPGWVSNGLGGVSNIGTCE
jgi:hypothetical protein